MSDLKCKRRYWLFAWDEHEPQGGMEDFVISSDSMDELNRAAREFYCWHILDTKTGKWL